MVIVQAMKIAVCVKQVPEAAVEADRSADEAARPLGEAALNAFDANAIEEALAHQGGAGEGEVVLVSLGPARRSTRCARLSRWAPTARCSSTDDAAAGSDLVATSHVLAQALERESADLVLFGQQASDSDGAVLWAAVADRLRLPVVSQVAELTVADGKAQAKRQTEFGYDVIEAPLPAVVAVSDAINEPRYPSLKGIMGAKSKPQETLSLADLGARRGAAGEAGLAHRGLALGDRRRAATR